MAPNQITAGNVEADSDSTLKPTIRKEILYDGQFYDVTEWVKRHPGGRIIEFYTDCGEDATLAIQQFHQRSFEKVTGIMSSLKKRPATAQALNEQAELDNERRRRHDALTKDFQALFEELKAEGKFTPSPIHVTYRLLEVAIFAALGVYLLFCETFWLKAIGVLSFAMFQGRAGWVQHEGGHHSLTGNPKADRLIQAVVFGLADGMAATWWSSQHNRHHAMPQRLSRDVDLETLPLLAFNSKVVKNPNHGRTFFLQNQAVLMVAVDTLLVSTMWKLYLHPRYVLRRGNYHQFIFMALHYVFAYHIGFIPYMISVWLGSTYIFLNFALSHSHLPIASGPLHWVEYAFLHTMDVESSWWCNWWMSYLNFHIEHHLFPTMPGFRHPQISDRVRKLAEKHGIPYRCSSYFDAVRMTFQNLIHVSEDLRQH